MLIINGCVCLETDLGWTFKWLVGHSNGWSDIPSKKEANKKGGEKKMGGKIGRKKRKKKIKKRRCPDRGDPPDGQRQK